MSTVGFVMSLPSFDHRCELSGVERCSSALSEVSGPASAAAVSAGDAASGWSGARPAIGSSARGGCAGSSISGWGSAPSCGKATTAAVVGVPAAFSGCVRPRSAARRRWALRISQSRRSRAIIRSIRAVRRNDAIVMAAIRAIINPAAPNAHHSSAFTEMSPLVRPLDAI